MTKFDVNSGLKERNFGMHILFLFGVVGRSDDAGLTFSAGASC